MERWDMDPTYIDWILDRTHSLVDSRFPTQYRPEVDSPRSTLAVEDHVRNCMAVGMIWRLLENEDLRPNETAFLLNIIEMLIGNTPPFADTLSRASQFESWEGSGAVHEDE